MSPWQAAALGVLAPLVGVAYVVALDWLIKRL
jgi:hypothetical protein